MMIAPTCLICGELAADNAVIDAAGSVGHRCTRTALLRCLALNADSARSDILHGREGDAGLRARNAYWYAREAGLLPWAPAPDPRPMLLGVV